ncbi:DDE superfamily endonuclease [Popillia japonica]|uniref:DDE superfamily endonuclease n=1 Tax=Popillia japonica TaxID=7064 RepID=A0AAW1JKZ8_POPJA
MKRNSSLTLKKPEHLQKTRKTARDPFIVYDFYDKLNTLFVQHNVMEDSKAAFIFNCDESGLSSDPSRLRGIGETGKPLCRISGGSGRETTSVLLCISANGSFLPPLIVFKGKTGVQARWTSENCYPGTQYATSTNGWMEEPQFYNWFKDVFILYVKNLREANNLPTQTGILIFDGHSSHSSIRIIEEALTNRIQLVRLPSHLTDRIQPLDKCVFGPLKIKWDKLLVNFGKTQIGQGSCRLTREKFGEFLGLTLFWQNSNWSRILSPNKRKIR